jgi:hypothetical protein
MMSEILIDFYCITPINAISSERTYEERARNGGISIFTQGTGVCIRRYGIIFTCTNSIERFKKKEFPDVSRERLDFNRDKRLGLV